MIDEILSVREFLLYWLLVFSLETQPFGSFKIYNIKCTEKSFNEIVDYF